MTALFLLALLISPLACGSQDELIRAYHDCDLALPELSGAGSGIRGALSSRKGRKGIYVFDENRFGFLEIGKGDAHYYKVLFKGQVAPMNQPGYILIGSDGAHDAKGMIGVVPFKAVYVDDRPMDNDAKLALRRHLLQRLDAYEATVGKGSEEPGKALQRLRACERVEDDVIRERVREMKWKHMECGVQGARPLGGQGGAAGRGVR